jgi:hypothetical protein
LIKLAFLNAYNVVKLFGLRRLFLIKFILFKITKYILQRSTSHINTIKPLNKRQSYHKRNIKTIINLKLDQQNLTLKLNLILE